MNETPLPGASDAVVAADGPHYRLRLYVAGDLPNSVQARDNLRGICDAHLPGRYSLEIVDFFAAPERALEDGVIVTPTLIRLDPAPRQIVVGSLSDRATVLSALDLQEPL